MPYAHHEHERLPNLARPRAGNPRPAWVAWGLSGEPPIGIEPMTYALRVSALESLAC